MELPAQLLRRRKTSIQEACASTLPAERWEVGDPGEPLDGVKTHLCSSASPRLWRWVLIYVKFSLPFPQLSHCVCYLWSFVLSILRAEMNGHILIIDFKMYRHISGKLYYKQGWNRHKYSFLMGPYNLLLNNCHCILFNITSKCDFSFFFLVKIIISKLVWFFPPSFHVITWYLLMHVLTKVLKSILRAQREADSRSSAGGTPVSPSNLTVVMVCADTWHPYTGGVMRVLMVTELGTLLSPCRQTKQVWGISPRLDVLLKDRDMAQLSSHPVSLVALCQ